MSKSIAMSCLGNYSNQNSYMKLLNAIMQTRTTFIQPNDEFGEEKILHDANTM